MSSIGSFLNMVVYVLSFRSVQKSVQTEEPNRTNRTERFGPIFLKKNIEFNGSRTEKIENFGLILNSVP